MRKKYTSYYQNNENMYCITNPQLLKVVKIQEIYLHKGVLLSEPTERDLFTVTGIVHDDNVCFFSASAN